MVQFKLICHFLFSFALFLFFLTQKTTGQEEIGKIIHCSGPARLYVGPSWSGVHDGKIVMVKDEIETPSDTYCWLWLRDGSLLRLSPESSVSFLDFQLFKKQSLIIMRFNEGFIHLSPLEKYDDSSMRAPFKEALTTDALFSAREMDYSELNFKKKIFDDPWKKLEKKNLSEYRLFKRLLKQSKVPIDNRQRFSLIAFPDFLLLGESIKLLTFVPFAQNPSLFIEQSLSHSLYSVGGVLKNQTPLDLAHWYTLDSFNDQWSQSEDKRHDFFHQHFFVERISAIKLMGHTWTLQHHMTSEKEVSWDEYTNDILQKLSLQEGLVRQVRQSFLQKSGSKLQQSIRDYDERFYKKAFAAYQQALNE